MPDEKDSRLLSNEAIHAIESVLTRNTDILALLEKRGISKADIENLCAQAKDTQVPPDPPQAKDTEDPPDPPPPARYSRTFSVPCGRLVLGQIRMGIREAAQHYDLDLDLQEEKGWVDCLVFGTVRGTEENIDGFSAALQNWIRANAD